MAVDSVATPPPPAPAATSFPVVFFDGSREIDVGSVPVHPSLEFKKFQEAVGQRIRVAPHQISIFLVRRKKARRKIPIDEASDFAAISRERDCFVLSVLRRPRRERRARSRRRKNREVDEGRKAAQEMMEILRQSPAVGLGGLDPALGALWGEEALLWDLHGQRERYFVPTAAASYCYYYPFAAAEDDDGCARRDAAATAAEPEGCEECEAAKAEGRAAVFHWCVHDAVTVGSRSPVGPIQRPSKKHLEAFA